MVVNTDSNNREGAQSSSLYRSRISFLMFSRFDSPTCFWLDTLLTIGFCSLLLLLLQVC